MTKLKEKKNDQNETKKKKTKETILITDKFWEMVTYTYESIYGKSVIHSSIHHQKKVQEEHKH